MPLPTREFSRNLYGWGITVPTLYGLLLGIDCLLFHQWAGAVIYLLLAATAGYALKRLLSTSAMIGE